MPDKNNWQDHYKDLPEYNNVKQEEPLIIAKFKFRSQEDFEEFNDLLKKHVYKTNKVFDGMQRKTEKQAWYPLKEKASKYLFVDEDVT
jgi:hypothetical protein